jgi:hypothetical protein
LDVREEVFIDADETHVAGNQKKHRELVPMDGALWFVLLVSWCEMASMPAWKIGHTTLKR